MKYEAVFGDKYLADKFTNERSVFIVDRSGVYFEFEDGGAGVNYIANFCAIGDRYYMRRIIPEPKRWTAEDQRAGRLPEVGAKYNVDGCEVKHLGVGAAGYEDIFHFEYPSGACGCSNKIFIKPIETPEEKVQCLRSEWINKAYVDFHRFGCEIEVLQKEQLKQVYDALLSGELPMPSKKGGE